MPGKRADDVKLRNVSIDDSLWEQVKAKAEREGMTASEAVRRLLREWVGR